MSAKEKFYGLGRNETAFQKRDQQLQKWEKSQTNKEPAFISSKRKLPRVKFGDSVVFLAAVQSGDMKEVERLISDEKADVNSVNKDGLTSLHQCCIDDDFEMVQLLVEHNANLNVHDNEGWAPLHAAASCGHDHIVSYLLDSGAFPAPVNNEGDTPEDLADDETILELLRTAIQKQGINITDVRNEEESTMLVDANRLKNDPSLYPIVSAGGATMLHVAAAKNYIQVLEVLLTLPSIVNDIDARDEDGWTALHAAVYWENMEAAEKLVSKGANVNVVTKTGDTIDDLCRPDLDDKLEQLKALSETANRSRCFAMKRQRPALAHSNSREDCKPSPVVVKRRSSRDRSNFPKKDMASEKAMIESWTPEELADGQTRELAVGQEARQGMGQNIDVFEERSSEQAQEHREGVVAEREEGGQAHDGNNVKEAVNSMREERERERGMAAEESNHHPVPSTKPPLPPGTSPQSSPRAQPRAQSTHTTHTTHTTQTTHTTHNKATSPRVSPQASPTICEFKRKPVMSGQMLKRVHLWEQQSSSSLNTPVPSTNPSTPDQPRGESGGGGGGGGGGDAKRFPFVPKTILQKEQLDAGQVVGGGGQRVSNGKLKAQPSSSLKRSSYDEDRLKSTLPDTYTPSKTSSLPRNARMVLPLQPADTVAPNNPSPSGHAPPLESPAEAEVAVTTTEARPTESQTTDEDMLRVAIGGGGGGGGGRGERTEGELGREMVRGDSVESSRSDRSFTEESETNRRRRAKKSRETRKKTQPLPTNILEQISHYDAKEIAKEEEVDKELEQARRTQDNHGDHEGAGGRKGQRGNEGDVVKVQVEKQRQEFVQKLKTEAEAISVERPPATEEAAPPKQSPFRPAVRPATRHPPSSSLQAAVQSTPMGQKDVTEVGGPPQPIILAVQHDEDREELNTPETREGEGEGEGDREEAGGKLHARLKSTVRRKPREQRKPTGIILDADSEELKDVSEEVARLFRREQVSAGGSSDSITEIATLKQELQQFQQSHSRSLEEIEQLKVRVAELNRRLEDATRAYEQERRENEEKSQKIESLEAEGKSKHELNMENQRLKDENSALIRVIGKLSRAPMRS